MTIMEVESRTGLDRGTVRYYETEGLIAPARELNGYRNYSEEDVEKLNKIKLLRALEFSIDDIRAMEADPTDFAARIQARIKSMEAKADDIEDARRILRRMLGEGAAYATLNAPLYLAELEGGRRLLESAPTPAPPSRQWDKPGMWRRLFARVFDMVVYSSLVDLFILFVLRRSTDGPWWFTLLTTVAAMGIMLLVEPLLISSLGTTPGKWLLGIYVTDSRGGRLPYRLALERTFHVLMYGYGFNIPIVSLWRAWVTFKALIREEEPEWEWYSTLHVRDRSGMWTAAYIAIVIGLTVGLYKAEDVATSIPHIGPLTVEEYVENLNFILCFENSGVGAKYDWWLDNRLHTDGTWTGGGAQRLPLVSFKEENGELISVTLSSDIRDENYSLFADGTVERITAIELDGDIAIMRYAALAFLGAQEGFTYISNPGTYSTDQLDLWSGMSDWWEDYTFTAYGVTVTHHIEYENCYHGGGTFLSPELAGGQPWCRYTLIIEKEATA